MKNIVLFFALYFTATLHAAVNLKDTKAVLGINTDVDHLFQIDRAGADSPYLKWKASNQKWYFSHDGITESEMGSGGSGGGISLWETATSYAVDTVVIESNKIYIALLLHTSGTFATDLAGGSWQLLQNQASAITVTPSGNLASTDTQAALVELQGDTDTINTTLGALDSTYATDSDVALKAPLASPTFTGTVAGITSAMVGLGNADNTSDANKPVSTATQTALDLKANIASPALTGNPTAPTQSAADNSTKIATTAYADNAASAAVSGVVLTTTDQSIAGTKTFTGKIVASSTISGSRPCPQMTNAQMLAVVTPGNGDCVYNTTFTKIFFYNTGGSTGWSADKAISWVTAFTYVVDDIVIEAGKIYRALTGHLSGTFATDLAANSWVEISNTLSVKSQSGSAVDATEIQFPANQLTNTATGKHLAETGNRNLLINPSFEHLTVGTGWTITATGTATCTLTASAISKLEGEGQHGILESVGGASGGTCSIKQSVNTTTGLNTLIGAMFRTQALGASVSNVFVAYTLIDGTRVTSRDLTNTGTTPFWDSFYVNEVAKTTSAGVELLVTVSAGATVNGSIDRAKVDQTDVLTPASIITPWQSYTPNFTGFGTVSTQSVYWRQVGSSIEIEGRFLSGTVSATEARISLPNSYTSSSQITTLQMVGMHINASSTANNHGGAVLIEPSVGYLTFGRVDTFGSSTHVPLAKANGDVVMGSAATVSFRASVPIANLSGSTQVFASQCGARCENNFSWKGSNTGVTSAESVNAINGNGVVSGTSIFTYTFDTSMGLTVAPNCTANANLSALAYGAQIDSVSSTTVAVRVTNDAGAASAQPHIVTCQKQGADYQASRTIVGSFKQLGDVAILSDVKSAGTEGGTCTSGSWATRTLNTEVDPNGIVSLSSNQFTLQAGRYEIIAFSPGYAVDSFRSKIRNITDSTDDIFGSTIYTGSGATSNIIGNLTLSGAKVFELQNRCQTTRATNGLGAMGVSVGSVETYSQVRIRRLSP